MGLILGEEECKLDSITITMRNNLPPVTVIDPLEPVEYSPVALRSEDGPKIWPSHDRSCIDLSRFLAPKRLAIRASYLSLALMPRSK